MRGEENEHSNDSGLRGEESSPSTFFSISRLRYRPLSREDELALARKFKWSRNPTTRETSRHLLVQANMGFVWQTAWKISRRWPNAPVEDLVQVGALHIHESIPKFNPLRGVRLLGFCGHQMQIRMWGEASRGVIAVPHSSYRKESTAIKAAAAQNVASLDFATDEGWIDDGDARRHSGINKNHLSSTEEEPIDELCQREERERIESLASRLLSFLDARERMIMEMRARGETLKQVGIYLGICKERVRQIEEGAVRKMKRRVGEAVG